ncbi:coth protein-domain-containing protein [Chlamydoabsidia padenii]|nr:coth protein-domain-containing protein [Chlamydoabsidia padenii]
MLLQTSILVALGLLTQASATTNTTYNVIHTAGLNHTMGVIVDGKAYPLQASDSIPILHTGSAPSGNYSYAKLDQNLGVVEKEGFSRPLVESTLNEFYNRTWNTQNLTALPTVLDPLPTIHRLDSPLLHPKDEIPTFYITGNQSQIDLMHGNTTLDTTVHVGVHVIGTQNITSLKNVDINLAGRSSKWMDKLSYGLKSTGNDTLFGYEKLKLRALRTDPSYVREILCYEMMDSMGLPASGASYARVIINNQPIGLFLVVEHYLDNWYENEFGNGKPLVPGRGIVYQGTGGNSDLAYWGDNLTKYDGPYKIEKDADANHQKNGTDKFARVMELTKFLSQAPTTNDHAVKVWNEHIDMDSVIRTMVVEIVAGFSDGFIANADNYFLYDNLVEKRFTFLENDFDTTLGSTLVKLADQWSGNYSRYPGFSLRPLTQKMIQVPEFKSQFEHLLYNASQQLIHPNVTNARIDDLVRMIRQDVDWDTTLPKVNPHPSIESDQTEAFGSPDSLTPPLDYDTIKDTLDRKDRPPFDFDTAINGPTHSISLSGVKEWFGTQSKALEDYFRQHPPLST